VDCSTASRAFQVPFRVTSGDDKDMANTAKQQRLSVDQTDELIRAVSPKDGAIEDAEIFPAHVTYFFETGAQGRVCRLTGSVEVYNRRH
jgi:hypothetical protein